MASKAKLSQIKADAIKAGWWKYVRTENDEKAALEGYRVDIGRGKHVCDFFETYLRQSQGQWAGEKFKLMDWQREELMVPLFGWVRPNGLRRFRRASVWVPKKNGKSSLASGIGLYALCADGERGAKVYCAANDRDQASIVFNECASMVNASPALSKALKVIRSSKRILKDPNTFLQAMSADAKKAEGLNAHFWIIDEIHVFNELGRQLRESLRFAGSARQQPMEFIISTAGDEQAGVGREEYEYAEQVIRGAGSGGVDDLSTFAYIREASADDDWTSPRTWAKANPSLGVTINSDTMAEECRAAVQSPRLQNTFKRYRLNIWTAAEQTALNMERWRECGEQAIDLDALVGLPVCGGVDLSSTTDLSAFALAFRHGDDYQPGEDPDAQPGYTFLVWMWLPKENIVERERNDRMEYRLFADQGHLHLSPGSTIAYGDIMETVKEQCARFGCSEIAFDPWNARKFAEDIERDAGISMVEVPQTTAYLNSASKLFESLVISGKLRHQNNPILNKMAADLCWYADTNGNIRPLKSDSKKRRRRIDGIVASILALSRVSLATDTRSIYETRGITFV